MKRFLYFFILNVLAFASLAQQEFHVTTEGKPTGDGSLDNPWDLHTALRQTSDKVNSGDFIYIHKGQYNGRFISTLQSNKSGKFVTVTAFENDKVVLNGNVESKAKSVLEVRGKNVIYKNFSVTFQGNYNRDQKITGFQKVDGINHTAGVDCKFINLKIYDNPGSGFGSWKFTGGSEIYDCIIFNNGFMSKAGRGGGVGLYVQNQSDNERLIKNNTIFNNYYKGIEVWSANKDAQESYVKNITLIDNSVFNNGTAAGGFKDNLIIASDDRNGINVPKNIKVIDNIFYHNTNLAVGQVGGDAASVTIGYNAAAAVEDVEFTNNIIIGRNNSFRLLHAKSIRLEDNIAYCGYIHMDASVLANFKNWDLENNTYYTKKTKAFRVIKDKDYILDDWKKTTKEDDNSQWLLNKQFKNNIEPRITPFYDDKNAIKVSIINTELTEVTIDISAFDFDEGVSYSIYDVENIDEAISERTLEENGSIVFNLNSSKFKKPLHNDVPTKSASNFGVFIVKFNSEKSEIKKEKSLLQKLFDRIKF